VRAARIGRNGGLFVRVVMAAVVAVTMLALALPAFAQEEQGQAFCDWYWDYKFKLAGGWEYWCWDPRWGWWYAESEDGKSRSITLKG
jgi:hypothetical protein